MSQLFNIHFNYINKNHKDTIVFFPGWAFFGELFDETQSTVNTLIINSYDPSTCVREFPDLLKSCNIKLCSCVGFSLGGYTTLQLLECYPNIVTHATCIGLRPYYPNHEIDQLLSNIKKNKEATLKYFYTSCFKEKADSQNFIKKYGNHWIKQLTLDSLTNGLLFLSSQNLNTMNLYNKSQCTFIHGKYDKIAPFNEISSFCKSKNILLKIKESGHLTNEAIFKK